MIQCFAKHDNKNYNILQHEPNLLYICKEDRLKKMFYRNMHMHEDLMEIILIYKGSGSYIIDEREYAVEEGDLIILNSGVLHEEIPIGETVNSYCVGFKNVKIENLPINQIVPIASSCLIKTEEQFNSIKVLMELMFNEIKNENIGAEKISSYALNTMISMILRMPFDNIEFSENLFKNNLSIKIKNYIDIHYHENISLTTISKELNVSPSYVSHSFKEATSYSPINYVIKRRIGEAQSLLINTDYSATKIATIIGYDNTNYFNTLFTRIVGMSPIKYRNNYIKRIL